MIGTETAIKVTASGVAAGAAVMIPAGALTVSEILLLVVFPLLAAWIGLAGLGVADHRPMKEVLREFVASVMLGGAAGLVALASIELLDLRGYPAALLTLIVGMGMMTLARKMRRAGGRLLDPLLAMLGLQRAATDDSDKED